MGRIKYRLAVGEGLGLINYLQKRLLLFISLFLWATNAQAAKLTLSFNDETNQAISQAVAVLTPLHASTASNLKPTAIMDQRNNNFVPGVLVVQANTLVYFPNGDNIRHHVYSFSSTKRFELRLYHGITAEPVLFDKPGLVVLGCNIHDSMLGYIYVVDSQYYGVADTEGSVVIDNIPEGEYQLQIQHPRWDPDTPAISMEKLIFTDQRQIIKTIQMPGLLPDPRTTSGVNELDNLFKR